MSDSEVEMVVVNYKTNDLLERFVRSYEEYRPRTPSGLMIVDVESEDVYSPPVAGYRWTAYLNNVGYATACNEAVRYLSPEAKYYAFFNADTRFDNGDCVDRCIQFMEENPRVGVVGPLQHKSDGTITHGGFFGSKRAPLERAFGQKVGSAVRSDKKAVTVSGSAMVVRRSAWEQLRDCQTFQDFHPGASGAFLPTQHYFEDTGLAYHAQSHDWEVWYLGSASMIHEHMRSPGRPSDYFKPSREIFRSFCDAHWIEHP